LDAGLGTVQPIFFLTLQRAEVNAWDFLITATDSGLADCSICAFTISAKSRPPLAPDDAAADIIFFSSSLKKRKKLKIYKKKKYFLDSRNQNLHGKTDIIEGLKVCKIYIFAKNEQS
jgi:hypothetical protein